MRECRSSYVYPCDMFQRQQTYHTGPDGEDGEVAEEGAEEDEDKEEAAAAKTDSKARGPRFGPFWRLFIEVPGAVSQT